MAVNRRSTSGTSSRHRPGLISEMKQDTIYEWMQDLPGVANLKGGGRNLLLPPASEVCDGYVFTPVCQSFCSQRGSASMHAGIVDPPWSRLPPPPGAETPPPVQCMLGDTGNKWLVRILLECIQVGNG